MSVHVLAQVCQDGEEMVAVCKCGVKRYAFVHNDDGSDAVADLNEHIAECQMPTDQLAALRAEVERLSFGTHKLMLTAPTDRESRMSVLARRQAFREVLDLIDKHAREGQ